MNTAAGVPLGRGGGSLRAYEAGVCPQYNFHHFFKSGLQSPRGPLLPGRHGSYVGDTVGGRDIGGGGGWYDILVCFGLQLAAPIGRSPLSAPFPSIGSGAHRPLITLCPSSIYLSLSTSLSFPLARCANGAPGLSRFHCSVSGPHRGGQLPSLLARCIQVGTPYRRWEPIPTAAFGP